MIYVGVSTLEYPKSTSKTDVNFCLSFQVNYYNNGNVHIKELDVCEVRFDFVILHMIRINLCTETNR